MTLSPEQLDRLAEVTTIHAGAGSGKQNACVMQWTDYVWRDADHFTDAPDCTPLTLRKFAIRLNDARWPSDQARTDALRPLIPYLVGADPSPEAEQKRMYLFADFAVREAAPYWFDWIYEQTKNETYRDHAAKLRAVAPIVDKKTAEAGRVVAHAADATADATAAAADAAAAAYAADNTAAYAAAATAAAAADAAAADNTAASAALPILVRAAEVLMAACRISGMSK